jgi:hypothetical protein
MDIFDVDLSGKDLPNVRTYDVGNNKINITRHDPFGFWRISYQRGAVPSQLDGQYTSIEEARRAVEAYLAEKGRTGKEVTQ